jgi:hypothetical protein
MTDSLDFDYAAAAERNHQHDLAVAKAALPAWFHGWAGDRFDSDAPPPTPTDEQCRAHFDALGMARYSRAVQTRTNPGKRSRALDRIRAAIRRWWR